MKTNSISIALIVLAIAMFVSAIVFSLQHTEYAFGSIETGQEYFATSTAASSMYGGFTAGERRLKEGSGSLGSVVITGATTGIVNFYNATTSKTSGTAGRSPSIATSTILIASLPASLAAGTYVFDASFNYGLLMVLDSGTVPTTTITYR